MNDFEKELIGALKDFEDRSIDLASWMERTKQAVSTHIIGKDDAAIDIFDNYRNSLRAKQRKALGGEV